MTFRTISFIGLVMFACVLLAGLAMAASPPYVKEGAPTEVTFDEDGSYLDLNLSDVFTDDDPEDAKLDLTNVEAEGLDITINQTTGNVNITGEEDWSGQVEVVFRAMDGRGYFADHGITVTVLPVNDPPEPLGKISRETWWEGDDHHFNVSQYFADVDGDDLYYYADPEPDVYSFINAENDPRNPMFDLICQHLYFYGYIQVVFTAYDKDPAVHGDEALYALITAIFEVKGVNSPPKVIDFEPQSSTVNISEMESATFSILRVEDVDSSSFRYYWYVDGIEMRDHTSKEFQYPVHPSYMTGGVYMITVKVQDNLGGQASNTPTWTLFVKDVNRLPKVDLVVDQVRVPYKENIILNATGSDIDGDELTYRWYRLTEDDRAKGVGDGNRFVYGIDLPPGRHYFKCEVSDGKVTDTSDWMLVTVEPIETPGPTGTLATMALLIATLSLAIASRRRGGHSKAY